MPLAFTPSVPGTLGVEVEFDIIDRETSNRRPIASSISASVAPNVLRGRIGPDLFESTLEFSTGVCRTIDEAEQDLRAAFAVVAPILDQHDAALLGMGLHPFERAHDAIVADADRYRQIMDLIGWPARRVTTNSIQVHVGMPSGDVAVSTAHRLRSVLPIVLALSASSPFRDGISTDLASTRTALFAAVPRSGPMPDFADWSDYANYCETMIGVDAMPSPLHTWWDCRLQPTLGTLEFRGADIVPDLDDALAIVALLWCLAVGVDALGAFQLPNRLSDENRWRAIRYGWRAEMLTGIGDGVASLSEHVDRLLHALEPIADALDCRAELEHCSTLGRGLGLHHRVLDSLTTSSDPSAITAASRLRVSW